MQRLAQYLALNREARRIGAYPGAPPDRLISAAGSQ
jgi:hypothetical protein